MMSSVYHHEVRTTLTLDHDVAARLEEEMHRRGESFKKTVNRILKLGLTTAAQEGAILQPFHVQPFDLGLREGLSYHSIGHLLEEIEGPDHR